MLQITHKKLQPYIHTVRKLLASYWAFPVALLVLVVGLALFGVSGSSVGTYDGMVNTTTPHFGPFPTHPRGIRADEWLVNTQMTIAQYNDGFPVINKHIGNGQDMSAVLDVPYKEWSVLFKPQNLMFFIAPLNFAFAFKWWLLAATLAFSVYALFLKLLPKQRMAAILLAGSVFLAPMIQWWYQMITIWPVAIGLLILTVLINIHQTASFKRKLLWLGTLSYLVAVFALVMYPPFQIPVAVVVAFSYAAYLIGRWVSNKARADRIVLVKTVGLVAASGALAGLVVGAYLLQHSSTIHTISQTVYPGHRDIAPGDYSVLHVLSNFLAPYNLFGPHLAFYMELKGGANQSEASSFLFPVVPLLLLGYYLVFRRVPKQNKLALALVWGSVIALTIFLLRLFVPHGAGFYKILALNLVPHNRLLIGIGFACILLLVGAATLIHERKITMHKLVFAAILLVMTAGDIWITHLIMVRNPGYVTHVPVAICAVVATVVFFGFLVWGRLRLALATFLILSFVCTSLANPLQHNLNEVTDTAFAHTVQQLVAQQPNARWVSIGAVAFENYALANGAKTLNGTQAYPQLALWRSLDPHHQSDAIYNRYAHVEFELDDTAPTPQFIGITPDSFALKLSACDPFLAKENVRYVYSMNPISSSCLTPLRTFTYPNATIYLYQRQGA